jgi:hypothetical protein
MNNLAKQLQESDIRKREALAKISKTQDEINKIVADKMSDKEKLEKLKQALNKNNNTSQNPTDKNEQEEKSIEQAAKKLNELAKKVKTQKLSQKEKEQIQKELEEIKKSMNEAGMKTDNLENAMNDIKKGQMDKASDKLNKESENLQKEQQEMDDIENIEESLNSLQGAKEDISNNQCNSKCKLKSMGKATSKKTGKKGPADFGVGSTNKHEIAAEGKQPGENLYTERYKKESRHNKGLYEKLYDPERYQKDSVPTKIKGQLTKGPMIKSTRSESRTEPKKGEKAKTEISERYIEYKTQGEESVKKEKIPGRYKNMIKNYYESIEP